MQPPDGPLAPRSPVPACAPTPAAAQLAATAATRHPSTYRCHHLMRAAACIQTQQTAAKMMPCGSFPSPSAPVAAGVEPPANLDPTDR